MSLQQSNICQTSVFKLSCSISSLLHQVNNSLVTGCSLLTSALYFRIRWITSWWEEHGVTSGLDSADQVHPQQTGRAFLSGAALCAVKHKVLTPSCRTLLSERHCVTEPEETDPDGRTRVWITSWGYKTNMNSVRWNQLKNCIIQQILILKSPKNKEQNHVDKVKVHPKKKLFSYFLSTNHRHANTRIQEGKKEATLEKREVWQKKRK